MVREMVIHFTERLGDRIIVNFFAENTKHENPNIKLHAYEKFNYDSVSDFSMVDWARPGLFESIFSDKERLKDLNLSRLYPQPGNLFVYAPGYAARGIYPSLKIPPKYIDWLSNFNSIPTKILYGRIVCFHILTDAPYQKSRNHYFPEWKRCIELLAKQGVTVIRVGKKDSKNELIIGENIYDLTEYGLTPSQSIAVISLCDIYVGGDTGMTHAAAALGKCIVGVWGDMRHMHSGKRESPYDIRHGDWNSGPYTPEHKKIILRRNCGPDKVCPIYKAEDILKSIDELSRREDCDS